MAGTQLLEIQRGWTVVDRDGRRIGKVVETGVETLRVKKGGFLGREITLPADVVAEIETGRVELSLTKDVIDQGW